MDNKADVLKIQGYDNFRCTAEKCRFTCCEGWDINIDENTYDKWEKGKDSTEYILKNIASRKCGKRVEYFVNKEIHETCPFLDNQGLCQIINNHGENYLSLTCRSFPRVENVIGGKREHSLSCACPEVVELISSVNGKINIASEGDGVESRDLLELKIRIALINIIQQDNLALDHKLIVAYQMLMELLKYKNFGKGALLNSIEKYSRRETVEEVIGDCNEIEVDLEGSIEEINYLFIDIIENYKEVAGLQELLSDISDFAEEADFEEISESWQKFKVLFEENNMLMENCIVSKVLSGCVSSDLKELIIAFELIVLEYLLVRYAVFMKFSMSENREINFQDIKDYIVAFSRVIENNTEAAVEFIKDGFGDTILEIGYLCFIALF